MTHPYTYITHISHTRVQVKNEKHGMDGLKKNGMDGLKEKKQKRRADIY